MKGQRFLLPCGMRRQGHGATAAHGSADASFGIHLHRSGQVVQAGQNLGKVRPIGANLDANGALPSRGCHGVQGKCVTDAVVEAQALEARGGQHDARILTFVQFAQARVQVASQGLNPKIGPEGFEQHGSSQAGGADHGARRQIV